MNLSFRLLLSLLFLSQASMAQETTKSVNDAWTSLRTQLRRRTDLVINLTNSLSTSTHVDQEELKKAKNLAADLFRLTDTVKTLDSVSISFASGLNANLTQVLGRTLVTLEEDQKLKNSNLVRDLQLHLEATENRLNLARIIYNEACTKVNRQDLLFR
jgi:LemA protein